MRWSDAITDICKTCREKGVETIFPSGFINRIYNDLKQNCDMQILFI